MRDMADRSDAALISVAVVIPAYNAAVFLRQTLRSVLDQTHDVCEIVVVDDGSTDATPDIARSFSDSRIKLITGSRRGVSGARNLGVNSTNSELIAFLDADDYWSKQKLTAQIAHLNGHPSLVGVGALMGYVSTAGSTLGIAGQDVGQTELDAIRKGYLMPFPLSSFLVRRDIFELVGGFDERLDRDVPGQVEDLDFLARVVEKGPIGTVAEVLGGYRIHSNSATVRNFSSQQMGTRYVQARLAAKSMGNELAWTEFAATYHLTRKERYRDRVRGWYRRAGVSAADRRWLAFIAYGMLAFLADPRYTVVRAVQQHRADFRPQRHD